MPRRMRTTSRCGRPDCPDRPHRPHNRRDWRRIARSWLLAHPLCERCRAHGRARPAEHVDHIIPIRHAPERMFDPANFQSLCHGCHSRKTAAERRGRILDWRHRRRFTLPTRKS